MIHSGVAVGTPVQMIDVIVPPGAYPGNQILISNPYSPCQQFQVTVPQGLAPGMSFQVQVPLMRPTPPPVMVMPPPPPPVPIHVYHQRPPREKPEENFAGGFLAGLALCLALDCATPRRR